MVIGLNHDSLLWGGKKSESKSNLKIRVFLVLLHDCLLNILINSL